MHHRSESPRASRGPVPVRSRPIRVPAGSIALVLGVVVAAAPIQATVADCEFIRGNIVDLAGPDAVVVDLNDAVDLVAYLTIGRSLPVGDCMAAADANDDGLVTMADYTYLVDFLFNDGPPPPPPFSEPGLDPTPDITVPEEPDSRFAFTIGKASGVPNSTGISVPVRVTNGVGIYGLTIVMKYDPAQIRIEEIVTENGTLLSSQSAEYIIAEAYNSEGIAHISALKDLATPFWFHTGGDPELPPGTDQLVATLKCAIVASAEAGFASIEFTDGIIIPNADVPADDRHLYPEVHNLVFEGATPLRPVLTAGEDGGGITVERGFIRGDGNGDDHVDIADPTYLLNFIFSGGRAPPCLDAADANNDTRLDISDPIWVLNYLFQGGAQPAEPFPQPGVDPSDDGGGSLGCESE